MRLALASMIPTLLAVGPLQAGLKVVTTLPDYAALAAEIGGERVSAEALVKGSQDPHFADARPSMIIKVNRADLLVFNGLSLEIGWLPVLLKQGRNAVVQPGGPGHLDASTTIAPREIQRNADRSKGDVHAGGNPHYFTSPDELRRVARAIRDRLVALDPDGRRDYEQRFTAFERKLDHKTAEWKQRLAPLQGQRVVVYHKSWIYLLEWAGLKRVGALEPKPGIPPSSAHVSKLLAQTREQGLHFVIQEVYHPTRLSRVFAEKAGAPLLILPSMVGARPGIETVWDKFDKIVEMLTDGR